VTTSRVRLAAAGLILAVLALLGARLVPLYLRNLELQRFVDETAQDAVSRTQPDELLRARVLQKAGTLGLPVAAHHVLISRPEGSVRIDVRYVVKVELPLYTVDLHFYPGAGSR
jgi:hypothetical protein